MSTTAKEAPSLLFSSLPNDILVNVLARVPRRFHPILSCVSKNLRSLVRSSELHKTRSLLRKDQDRFCVCFTEHKFNSLTSNHWFSFTENRRLVSIPFPSLPEPYSAVITVGPHIYFFGRSRSMWVLDSRSGKLLQGPRLLVANSSAAVGLVNDKIYIFGGRCQKICYQDIQAQVFDLKTQTWQIAPNPSVELQCLRSVVTPSLGRKIYARDHAQDLVIVYDTRDGKCDKIIPAEQVDSRDMCVVDNVLYMLYPHVGLMWYHSKEEEWIMVHGLDLNGCFDDVAMAEYNGKLVFLWQEKQKSEVWCAMIALYGTSKVAIRGCVEWSECLLSDIPFNYYIRHFIVCTD